MGPTCSGKTALAMKLADEFPLGIINVDSTQVYRGLNIGAAKPDAKTLAQYPHALIDICDPNTPYNVADFCQDAKNAIETYIQAGKVPLLVGGTMMYFKALLQGLSALPSSSAEIRTQISAEAEILGWPFMHARLAEQDPEAAAKIKPQDAQRIGRALEVCAMTGERLSALQATSGEPFAMPCLTLGLMPSDRATLHARIAQRFEDMLAQGFLEEAQLLYKKYGDQLSLPALRSVGYRQAFMYLQGAYDEKTFKEKAIAATRQLAKRQMTWLRSWEGCQLSDPDRTDSVEDLKEKVAIFLSKI